MNKLAAAFAIAKYAEAARVVPGTDLTENDHVPGNIPGGKSEGHRIGEYDWDQILKGLNVETDEHTGNAPFIGLEIACDHLQEIRDYYDRLAAMEETAKNEGASVEDSGENKAAGLNSFLLRDIRRR